MDKSIIISGLMFTAFLFTGCGAGSVKLLKQPGQHPQSFEKKITKVLHMNYLIYLPDGYAESKEKFPAIFFLHGMGERGNDLEKIKVHGPPLIVEQKKDFPFIVISPQCPLSETGWDTEVLINLLDDVVSKYKIDEDRIYLTGLSMGGFGTWALAIKYPERFAAIAPVCGGGTAYMAGQLKNVPVWVFHGAKDKTVPIRYSQDMVDALKKHGADVKFTVYPEAGHDSWTETYDNPELYEWFLKHKRKVNKE